MPPDPKKTLQQELADNLPNSLVEQQLKANAEAYKGASMADLTNPDSLVYKAPIREKPDVDLPQEEQFDSEGYEKIPVVRTYEGDLTNAVNRDQLTVTKIAVAEESRKQRRRLENSEEIKSSYTPTEPEKEVAPEIQKNIMPQNPALVMTDIKAMPQGFEEIDTPKKSFVFPTKLVFIILSVMLVLGGLGTVGYTFIQNGKKNQIVVRPGVDGKPIIITEEKVTMDISNISKLQAAAFIKKEAESLPQGAKIREIEVGIGAPNPLRKATLEEFLYAIEARPPEELIRSLYPEFFLGVDFKGSGEPFMIWFTSAYDISVPALLGWEGFLKEDLAPVFGRNFDLKATSTKEYNFKDRVILNQDTRSLQNNAGDIMFFYTVMEGNIIIFAESQDALREIMDRLREVKLRS